MEATSKARRRKASRKPADSSVIHVETKDGTGNPRWVTARLADVIDSGCGLMLMTLLRSGSTVVVRGRLGGSRATEHLEAAVRWCIGRPDGTFRAGLEFLNNRTKVEEEQAGSTRPDTLDCYEVMQLSPNADAETISRVYRILASRYHPDNAETGDSEKFIRLCEAHEVLSDPAKRARYDVRHGDAMQLRSKAAFAQATVSSRGEQEDRRRFDRVRDEAKVPHGRRRKGDHFVQCPGTLRGWSAALGHPTS
jgi:hypothetical protein